jgi:hypothetical protein
MSCDMLLGGEIQGADFGLQCKSLNMIGHLI